MVWLEPTTNPTLKMTDIKAVCEMAKKKNPKILIGVDNTFCSPYFLVNFLNIYRDSLQLSNLGLINHK